MARTSNITLELVPSFTRFEKGDYLASDGRTTVRCYKYRDSFKVFICKAKGLVTVTSTTYLPSKYLNMKEIEFNPFAFSEVCRKIYNTKKGIREDIFIGREEIVSIED